MDKVRGRAEQSVMAALSVTERSTALCFMKAGIVAQVDLLMFWATPETFDEDVVETTAVAVHTDADLGLAESD